MNPFNTNQSGNNMNLSALKRQFLSASNPRALINQLANQNPNLRQISSLLNGNVNAENVVRQLCRQRGIDFNQFMNNLKNM